MTRSPRRVGYVPQHPAGWESSAGVRPRPAARWLLVLGWLLLIFMLSSQTAVESSALSSWVMDAWEPFLRLLGDTESGEAVSIRRLRKGAHVAEYLVLGGAITWAWYGWPETRDNRWRVPARADESVAQTLSRMVRVRSFSGPLVVVLVVAVLDESLQGFIPGRGPSAADVLVDLIGGLLGIIAVSVMYQYRRWAEQDELREPGAPGHTPVVVSFELEGNDDGESDATA